MNPHTIFVSVMLVSVATTAAAFAASGSMVELVGMAQWLGVTLACVGVVLFATRKYWRNARRMA